MTPQEIKSLRESKHWSIDDLARAMGVTTDAVRSWESGRRTPSGTAVKLLEVYGRDHMEHNNESIPIHIVQAACEKAYDEDADQVIGFHRIHGWVYRHIEDEGGIAELTKTVRVNSSGIVD